jgi:hypothetical protein
MAEEERLSGERVRELYLEAGDPDVPLLDMWLAGRLAIAQSFDRGELAADDVEAAMAAAAEAANVALRHLQIGLRAERTLADAALGGAITPKVPPLAV